MDDQLIRTLAEQEKFLLFLHEQRFHNPLIPAEAQLLEVAGLLNESAHAVIEALIAHSKSLPAATYFPTPIARSMTAGQKFSIELAKKFSYAHMVVNAQQQWSSKGEPLDERIQRWFVSNLHYEPCIERYYVEYQVDQRWDKCYLQCETTPMVAVAIHWDTSEKATVELNNGQLDPIDLESLRLDQEEHLYVQSSGYGLVLLGDNPRYSVLDKMGDRL